jgi:hypothetical protein
MNNLIGNVPDAAFFGLQTKAGIRVTTAAALEKTRAEGGSAQAVNDFLYEAHIGRKVRVLNLHHGTVEEERSLSELTVGEYIFWRSLEIVLSTPLPELRSAYMVGVMEPGKTRVVTKTMVSLKIVLDVVNGICSWPLAKGFESSSSGMLKEAHGWNFFKEFYKHADEIFRVHTRNRTRIGQDNFVEEILYEDIFVSSTDYETATDSLNHNVAKRIAIPWMTKCGIPEILRGIVVAVCYQPRTIYFSATGCLKAYGETTDEENNINALLLRRGVLMGDPLTKVVLHFTNILTRRTTSLEFNRITERMQRRSAG